MERGKGVLTMTAFDHTDECGETLLRTLGYEACTSPDTAYSVGYDSIICVIRVILVK
jgi:hypothetical protein